MKRLALVVFAAARVAAKEAPSIVIWGFTYGATLFAFFLAAAKARYLNTAALPGMECLMLLSVWAGYVAFMIYRQSRTEITDLLGVSVLPLHLLQMLPALASSAIFWIVGAGCALLGAGILQLDRPYPRDLALLLSATHLGYCASALLLALAVMRITRRALVAIPTAMVGFLLLTAFSGIHFYVESPSPLYERVFVNKHLVPEGVLVPVETPDTGAAALAQTISLFLPFPPPLLSKYRAVRLLSLDLYFLRLWLALSALVLAMSLSLAGTGRRPCNKTHWLPAIGASVAVLMLAFGIAKKHHSRIAESPPTSQSCPSALPLKEERVVIHPLGSQSVEVTAQIVFGPRPPNERGWKANVCIALPQRADDVRIVRASGFTASHSRGVGQTGSRLIKFVPTGDGEREIVLSMSIPALQVSPLGGLLAPSFGWRDVPIVLGYWVERGDVMSPFFEEREFYPVSFYAGITPVSLPILDISLVGFPKDLRFVAVTPNVGELDRGTGYYRFQLRQWPGTGANWVVLGVRPRQVITGDAVEYIVADGTDSPRFLPAVEEWVIHFDKFVSRELGYRGTVRVVLCSLEDVDRFGVWEGDTSELSYILSSRAIRRLTANLNHEQSYEGLVETQFRVGNRVIVNTEPRKVAPLSEGFKQLLVYLYFTGTGTTDEQARDLLRGHGYDLREFSELLSDYKARKPGFETRLAEALNDQLGFKERKLTSEQLMNYIFKGT